MKSAYILGVAIVSCLLPRALSLYSIPNLNFELIPKGFRISIPDETAIKFVAFHGNKNRNFTKFGPGDFSGQIREPTDGRWIYENTRERLKNGDHLYIWTNVQVGQVNYRRFEKPILITANTDSSGPVTPTAITPTPDSVTVAPKIDIDKCGPSETIVRKQNVCKGQLIFEETFDDTAQVNWTRWQLDVRMPLDKDDAEFVVFDNRAENCYVRDGLLHIVPTLWMNDEPGADVRIGEVDLGAKCTGVKVQECKRRPDAIHNVLPSVVSARLQTKDFFSFVYGRVEVRAKLPQGDWLLPLILLEPFANFYGREGFASGQLRIAFARGNTYLTNHAGEDISGSILYGGAVVTRGEALRGVSLASIKERGSHYGKDFHVYTLTWTSRNLKFEVDGREYANISGGFQELYESRGEMNAASWRSYMAPFDKEFYLTLGVSAGGHSDFPDNSNTGSPSSQHRKPWHNDHPKAAYNFWRDRTNWKPTWNADGMQVDYVRVYAV